MTVSGDGGTRELAASVVVATRDRSDRLIRLLHALDRQEGPAFEVVIVDDGSTDGTSEKVHALAPSLSIPVRVIRQEKSTGQAGARNRAWRAASAPVVLFTDDDCVPVPKWVGALVEVLDREGADIATGETTFPDDQAALRGVWSYWMEDDGQGGYFSTCNVAYRRSVLEALDGLDERFQYRAGRGGARCMIGDDTDLGWRGLEAGFRSAFAPGAVVYHDVFPQSWFQYLRNMRRLEGLPLLYSTHPQLRTHFGRRWVHRSEDLSALAVVAGLVGLGSGRARRPLLAIGLLGAAWHTRVYLRYKPWSTPSAMSVPLGVVADAYAAFVMLRGSVRYRTLLI